MTGLPVFKPWPRQVDHLRRLHVAKSTEHLLKLRHVYEFGEPATLATGISTHPSTFPADMYNFY
jgi:hypothetical protein